MLTKFLNDEKLTFATNLANLPTSWLQTCQDLFGSLALIFHLKFRIQFHLFLITLLDIKGKVLLKMLRFNDKMIEIC
ncbi:hypothetical protein RN96_11090 [Fusobacterium polymorphum]|uniref:PIN family toxin-antitoxin system n=1 Tax=Fusobacterium nucleatum subsp. polymorphum TaxID=76857 RepID=A0A2B7YGH3_FUSNP|nr:hypothetical protein RN96_11090 [Fusobacterium polymorphum]